MNDLNEPTLNQPMYKQPAANRPAPGKPVAVIRRALPMISLAALLAGGMAVAQNETQTAGEAATGQPQIEKPGVDLQSGDTAAAPTPTAGQADQTDQTDIRTDAQTAAGPAADSETLESADTAALTESVGAGATLQRQADNQVLGSSLMGLNIVNNQDEDIAEIVDLVVDKDSRIAGVVLSVGGFLGIGDKNIAVDWDQLELVRIDGEQIARVDMTREQLEAAPAFETLEAQQAEQQAAEAQARMQQPIAPTETPAPTQ